MRLVRRWRTPGDPDRASCAEVPPRRLVVAPEPFEPRLESVVRRRMAQNVIPAARHVAERGAGIALARAEARVRDREHLLDERRVLDELDGGGAVQGQRDPEGRIAGVVALTAPECLDDVTDRVGVPVVDEERRRPRRPPAPPEESPGRPQRVTSTSASTTRSALCPSSGPTTRSATARRSAASSAGSSRHRSIPAVTSSNERAS